ncbi:hypothetical protein [Halopseudomonas xiamenensis]|nr:hypothetical protein [Halopseudomonas xiamenensis]
MTITITITITTVILREGEGSTGRSKPAGTVDPRPTPRITGWGEE